MVVSRFYWKQPWLWFFNTVLSKLLYLADLNIENTSHIADYQYGILTLVFAFPATIAQIYLSKRIICVRKQCNLFIGVPVRYSLLTKYN